MTRTQPPLPRSDVAMPEGRRLRAPLQWALALLPMLVATNCARDPCTPHLEGNGTADLVFRGSDTCPGQLRLRLWVAAAAGDSAVKWYRADAAPVQIEGKWSARDGAAIRSVRAAHSGPEGTPVHLHGLVWQTPSGGGFGAADRLLHNGYQSWNYTGFEPIPSNNDAWVDVTANPRPMRKGGQNEDVISDIAGLSWWWSALASAGGNGITAGFAGASVLKGWFVAERVDTEVRAQIVYGLTGESITLTSGQERELDGLYIRSGNVRAALDAYAAHVAEAQRVAPRQDAPLGGWGSWNLYFEDVDSESLGAEISWAAENLKPLGFDDFLLDDGYMPYWGQWRAAERFGATLAEFAARQREEGLRPAIWVAPTYLSVDDPLIAEHPAWFVHDTAGEMRTYNNFGPTYAALDPTHPDARAFVTEQLEALWEAGYRTYKIDFLFGGALEGEHHQEVTSMESYHTWMRAIRDALPQAHLIGCGAPMLPSVGWVDSMRTGPDISYVVQPEPAYGYLAPQARHTATRFFTDRWWHLDPDVVLLRGDQIDDQQAWTHVVSAAFAGGNYLLGDLRQAPTSRQAMALAPEILAMADGRAMRPLDMTAQTDADPIPSPLFGEPTHIPHLWEKLGKAGQKWLAVFGWNDGYSYETELPAGTVELSPPSNVGEELAQTPIQGRQTISVDPRGVRLFALGD
mgnify:FL=1